MFISQIKRLAPPVFVLVALAFAGPATAGVRPDDRGSVHGVGTSSRILPVRPDDRAGIRGIGRTGGGVFTPGAYAGPAGSGSTGDRDLPGDNSVPSWPYETGALLGTSETFIDVRDDGSYFDPSIGRRVFPVS